MEGRVYDRLAAALSITFLLVLGAATYYLAAWATRDTSPQIQRKTNDPNVFVEGVSLTRTGVNGEPVFQMSAQSMRHFPFDGSSEFLEPRLVSLDTKRPKVTVKADRAIASKEGKQTVLTGNVVLTRQAAHDAQPLQVLTERLTLISDTELAKTDDKVRIRQGPAHLTAVGMEFDNQTRNLKLISQVRAVWPDAAKPVKKTSEPSGKSR